MVAKTNMHSWIAAVFMIRSKNQECIEVLSTANLQNKDVFPVCGKTGISRW